MSECVHGKNPEVPSITDIAFVFPGQGSQILGMGRSIFDQSPAGRAVMLRAEDAYKSARAKYSQDADLPDSLLEVCFDGDENIIKRTPIAQPGLVAVSTALIVAAMERNPYLSAKYLAGHSLGEYSALVAAGMYTVETAVELTHYRGYLMERVSPPGVSTMAAVQGMDIPTLGEICDIQGVEISNYNAPNQIIIAGYRNNIIQTMGLISARGGKSTELQVAAAFHSSIMKPIEEPFAEALAQYEAKDPQIGVVLNVTGEPSYSATDIQRRLVEQLTGSVLWMQSVKRMHRNVGMFIEFGPRATLSGLIRHNDRVLSKETGRPPVKVISVTDYESLAQIEPGALKAS